MSDDIFDNDSFEEVEPGGYKLTEGGEAHVVEGILGGQDVANLAKAFIEHSMTEQERLEAMEKALRQKYPNDALERLVQSNYDYYSTHGNYLPELAQLLLIERDQLEQAERERDIAVKLLPSYEYGKFEQKLAAQSKESEDSRA